MTEICGRRLRYSYSFTFEVENKNQLLLSTVVEFHNFKKETSNYRCISQNSHRYIQQKMASLNFPFHRLTTCTLISESFGKDVMKNIAISNVNSRDVINKMNQKEMFKFIINENREK